MSRARAAAALLAAVAALSGCAAIHTRQPVPGTAEGQWASARLAATRRFELYDGLVYRATATATHLGLEEREARARRLSVWLGWTSEELARRLEEERAAAGQEELFLVSFYASDWKSNDLDAPRSVWRLAVHVDDAEILPTRVEAIDANTTVTGLFPYIGTFDVVYLVHFPPAPGGPLAGRPYVFRLASAVGKIDLAYPGIPDKKVGQPAPGVPAP